MRYLYTLLFAALSFSAFSQNNSIHVYPWNPDANHNNSIGADDLLPFLSVYGEEFGLPPEPCTYDGTALEEYIAGRLDGSIVLDSMYIEYEVEDVSTYFPPGCPNAVTDTIVFSNSVTLFPYASNSDVDCHGHDSYGADFFFYIYYQAQYGSYAIKLLNTVFGSGGLDFDGFFGSNNSSDSPYVNLPFPEDWYLDEEGIHIDSGWDEGDWVYYANYIHILPYWHYADE